MNSFCRRVTGCLLLIVLVSVKADAQSFIQSYVPPSPTAASLGVYGQVPVSEYSGVPDIKVDLYNITLDGFNVPVNLSYHSGGFRFGDEASWVGLGWSLNAGGVITRSKRHKDDFGAKGFFRTVTNRPCNDDTDQEPDVFYYNFNGLSGKFLIDGPSGGNNFTIRQFLQSNLKIEYFEGRGTWRITTGDGVIYRFEETEFTTETTVAAGSDTKTESYTSSWYLSSIELLNGRQLFFRYLTPNNTKISRVQYTINDDRYISHSPSFVPLNTCCPAAVSAAMYQRNDQTNTVNISERVLSQIDYPNGMIKFNTSARTDLMVVAGTSAAKKLENMEVYVKKDDAMKLLKKYSFTYDHYNSNSGNPSSTSTRLRLLSVKEQTASAMFNPYQFQYGTSYMPDKSTSISYFLDSSSLLKTIIYPTGGMTNFTFQSHPTGGGTRILRISSKDPDSTIDVRRFEYTGGKLMGRFGWSVIVPYTRNFTLDSGTCCGNTSTIFFTVSREARIFADFSSLSETVNGYLVGYDKVVTYYGENGENGKKESFFENVAPANPNYMQGNVPVPVPLNTANKNGMLKEEGEYHNNSGTFIRIKRTVNTWASANVVNIAARRFAFDKCIWTYTVTTEWVRLATQAISTYDISGGNPITATTNYTYDNTDNVLPTKLSTTDSKGATVLTVNSYTKEKSAQVGGVYTTMLNKHITDVIIQQDKSKNTVPIEQNFTNYRDWYNNGKVLLPETVQFRKGSFDVETNVRYLGYTEQGNVISISKEAGRPISYIWGYGNQHPIAEISNGTYQPVGVINNLNHNVGRFLTLTDLNYQPFETFTTNYAQTYNFSMRIIPIGSPTFTGAVRVQFRRVNLAAGDDVLFDNTYYGNNTYTGSATLPSGTNSYYFAVQVISPGSGITDIRFDETSTYQFNKIQSNIIHTSFEELLTGFSVESKTGRKSFKGAYTFDNPLTAGNYILSWWQKPQMGPGTWTFNQQIVNVTGSAGTRTIGNNSVLIDEVRMYPQDAMMTTYTYDVGIGMTSKCDERNRVTYYEYDTYNRLKLTRDNDKNILQTFEYNYKK